MKNSRGWAVLCLLSVVGGGVVLVAETMYDLSFSTGGYEFSGMYGFLFLIGGVSGLVGMIEQQRPKAVGLVGLFVGILLFVFIDGFVQSPLVYYAGIAILVVTGISLFFVRYSDQQNANLS